MPKYFTRTVLLALLFALFCSSCSNGKEVKLLYWNIQNGMWHDQGNNYDHFVEFVKEQDPDICIWCEAESRYITDTADKMQMPEDQYLPWNWDLLARRYGHEYVLICGKRDTFPQVITSKYPIRIVKRLTGNGEEIIVAHGAGWAQIDLGGKQLNIVTVHTWPQRYAYKADDQAESAARHEGDIFRASEVRYICEESIGTAAPGAADQLWLMTGDFNAISSVDNFHYGKDPGSTEFLVHDYILGNTPYLDLVHERFPGEFKKSTLSGRRIDVIYVTPALEEKITEVTPLYDGFAASERDPRGKEIHNFCHPSDHYPIQLTIKM